MSDLISREQAIDVATSATMEWDGMYVQDLNGRIREAIEQLPPIQPEIVRCKDCKHRDPEDKKCDCGHDILWQLPRQDDWYCADAERREVTT